MYCFLDNYDFLNIYKYLYTENQIKIIYSLKTIFINILTKSNVNAINFCT